MIDYTDLHDLFITDAKLILWLTFFLLYRDHILLLSWLSLAIKAKFNYQVKHALVHTIISIIVHKNLLFDIKQWLKKLNAWCS